MMTTLQSFSIRLFFIGLLFGLSGYFVYYAIHGPRGHHALQHRKKTLVGLEKEFFHLKKNHDFLEKRVQLLQDRIDPDLLEQLVWKMLRYIEPDKQVFLDDSF